MNLIRFGVVIVLLSVANVVTATSGISFHLVYPQKTSGTIQMKSVDGKSFYWVSRASLMQVSHAQRVDIKDSKRMSEEMKKQFALKGIRVDDPPKDKKDVFVMLSIEDSQKFFKMTSDQVKQVVAVVMNGVVLSAPRIYEPINAGSFQVSNMTPQIAQKISELAK